jgi:hypothetical protein
MDEDEAFRLRTTWRHTLAKISAAAAAMWIAAWAIVLLVPIPGIAGFHAPLAFLSGILLAIFCVLAIFVGQPRFVAAIVLVVVLGVGWFGLTRGLETAAWLHFRLRHGHYEQKVAQLRAATDPDEHKRICGEECFEMANHKVSFHYIHGFLSWYDIVYDPNGELMEQDWMKKKQIDIYFIGAKPLAPNWYLAHFGD